MQSWTDYFASTRALRAAQRLYTTAAQQRDRDKRIRTLQREGILPLPPAVAVRALEAVATRLSANPPALERAIALRNELQRSIK